MTLKHLSPLGNLRSVSFGPQCIIQQNKEFFKLVMSEEHPPDVQHSHHAEQLFLLKFFNLETFSLLYLLLLLALLPLSSCRPVISDPPLSHLNPLRFRVLSLQKEIHFTSAVMGVSAAELASAKLQIGSRLVLIDLIIDYLLCYADCVIKVKRGTLMKVTLTCKT